MEIDFKDFCPACAHLLPESAFQGGMSTECEDCGLEADAATFVELQKLRAREARLAQIDNDRRFGQQHHCDTPQELADEAAVIAYRAACLTALEKEKA